MPAFAESAGGLLTDKQIDVIMQRDPGAMGQAGNSRRRQSACLCRKIRGRSPARPSRLRDILRILPRPRWPRRPERQRHHERFVFGAGQRSGAAHDRHRRPSGVGGARLARQRSRQADVRPGSHRRRCLARFAPRAKSRGNPIPLAIIAALGVRTMPNETTLLSRRGLFMKLGMLFNACVAPHLPCRSGDFCFPRLRAGARTAISTGYRSAPSVNSRKARRGWQLSGILS